MKPNIFVWALLLAVGPLRTVGMAAESQESVSPCAFEIAGLERRYSYFADFAITVTNRSNQPVVIRHFEGAPFEITFFSGGKSFVLRHKAEEYAVERGASRPPEETKVAPFGATSFVVDLKGDYVVVRGGRPFPFRDFAAGKEGTIIVKPLDQALFPKNTTHRPIQWDGKSIVLP